MNQVWRDRAIILDPELVERLYAWHGGQGSSLYRLASWAQNHLVSLSMIDAGMRELMMCEPSSHDDRLHLDDTVTELGAVRLCWREHSAHEAGMSSDTDGVDDADYGLSEAEESETDTASY